MAKVTLSKDLPGGRVRVPEGSEQKSYYKWFLEPMHDIPQDVRQEIMSFEGSPEEALEPEDRAKVQDAKSWPGRNGIYRLRRGGLLVSTDVKMPNVDGDMLAWFVAWEGLDHLRNAIWDPEDHYSVHIEDKDRARALDPNVPVREKLWYMHHTVSESFDRDKPSTVDMYCQCPWEVGFDKSLDGTPRTEFMISTISKLGPIPVFMVENLCQGEDGVRELRLRFWIGYELQPDGSFKCKVPKFLPIPPKSAGKKLAIHNFREFGHLNEILPGLYAEQKDNWEG